MDKMRCVAEGYAKRPVCRNLYNAAFRNVRNAAFRNVRQRVNRMLRRRMEAAASPALLIFLVQSGRTILAVTGKWSLG